MVEISKKQTGILLVSILIVALCGIVYELIISTVSSYLLGNSVWQFSLTIGIFMFAMAIGAFLTKLLNERHIENFISIEIAISIVGGLCSIILLLSFPLIRPLYETIMYTLILFIGALVGMEIPLLTAILSAKQSARDSISNALSLDYLGALIGSVAFPLFLLPSLGLLRSSFAIGLINIFTALVNLYFFKKNIKNFKLLTAIALFILASLVFLTLLGTKLTLYAEKHLYFDQIIYNQQTPYQKITITSSNKNKENRLYIDGHIQFSSRDEYRYHEALVHPIMSLEGKINNVLVLGGGDGLAVREILKYPKVQQIHLVDIDPEMTKLAKHNHHLATLNKNSINNPKVTVFNVDAFSFINKAGLLYDRVIIDMPDPHNEAINKLYSKEFYTMIRKRTTPNAYIVSQSSSPFFTRRTFWSIKNTLDLVFDKVQSYHVTIPSFGIWGFNIASKQGSINKEYKFTVDSKFISSQTMQAALTFGKDIAALDTPTNSILEPKLYHLYLQDLSD